jgi:hypothetical protein
MPKSRDGITRCNQFEHSDPAAEPPDFKRRKAITIRLTERSKALVSVSGYLIGSQAAGKVPLPPKAELQWCYQIYFATERGEAGYEKYRRDFAKLIWQLASPGWNFDNATFARSAASFDNPDHVKIVIHNYRWRQTVAEGEPEYNELEKRLAAKSRHRRAHHHPGM